MTTQKKQTRRKAYKYMSVSELVKARAELADKMKEIDNILKLAVEAYGTNTSNNLRTTPSRNFNNFPGQAYPNVNDASIGVSSQPPAITPNPVGKNIESAFSLFDTDSWVKQQNQLAEQQQVQSEYDVNEMQTEIASLQNEISQELNDVQDTPTTPEEGE